MLLFGNTYSVVLWEHRFCCAFKRKHGSNLLWKGCFFPPLLPFDLIIWHSQSEEFLGDGTKIFLLRAFFFLFLLQQLQKSITATLVLDVFFCWQMEVAGWRWMRSVSRFKQAAQTPWSSSRGFSEPSWFIPLGKLPGCGVLP